MNIVRLGFVIFPFLLCTCLAASETLKNTNTEENATTSQLDQAYFALMNTTICDTFSATGRDANSYISFFCSSMHQPRIDLSNCVRLPPPPDLHSTPNSYSSRNPHEELDLNSIMREGMSPRDTQNHSKTVVVVLGNTGSGKTTLTQIIAGNLSRLHGVLTSSSKLVVVDEDDRIGAPSIKSKTIYPEYITNPETNTSFYDCPGFDDNRGARMDIAAMFSLKSITDSIHQAKFLFTVPHSSVRIGNDRLDFDLLVKHAARFLRNMYKLKDSIGLIVTKVSSYSTFGNYLTDEEIIGEIVEFLLNFRQTVQERLSSSVSEDRSEMERKLEFIESVLKRENDTGPYKRIWFVRNPPRCGPFNEIPYATQVRQKITELYQTALSFAHMDSTDFGITLKDSTLLQVEQQFIPEIQTNIENGTEALVLSMKAEYFDELNSTLEQEEKRRGAILKLKRICEKFYEMGNSSFELSRIIPEIVNQFGADLTKKAEIDMILKQELLLRFFASLTNKSVDNSFLKLITTQLVQDMNQARECTWNRILNEFVNDLNVKMKEELSSLLIKLEKTYLNRVYEAMAQRDKMNSTLATIESEYKNLRKVAAAALLFTSSSEEVIDQLYPALSLNVEPQLLKNLTLLEEMYSFYEQVTATSISREKSSLITSISNLVAKINDLGHWYEFIIKVDSKLARYSSQVRLNGVNETTLKNYGDDLSFLEELHLTPTIPQRIRNISRDSRVDERAKQQLHDVILSVLTEKTRIVCENKGERAIIKGRFVKFSDFVLENFNLPCDNGMLKELQIFSTQTVFIDKDIFARGKLLHLSILSPRWEVVGGLQKQICVGGHHGASFEESMSRAHSGDDYGNSGNEGHPGAPGGNGGSFFGLYDELVNGHLLKINVDGGDGGEGQHGGHGFSGRNGKNADRDDFPSPYLLGRRKDTSSEFETYDLVFTIVYNQKWFEKKGSLGDRGGNGGSGGVGGTGGYPGFVTLQSVNSHLNQSAIIEVSRSIGHVGYNGKAGLGGRGGKTGNSYKCSLRSFLIAFWWSSCDQVQNDEMAERGTDGVEGGNPIGQLLPVSPTPPEAEWKVRTDYKHFVLESGSQTGINFLRRMESISNLATWHIMPLSFAHELFNLERLYYQSNYDLRYPINFLQEYQILLERIESFLQTNSSKLTSNQNKTLNFLCASILSKISVIHQKKESSSVVTNLSAFLSAISADMSKLKDGQMRELISRRKQELHSHLKEKQIQANVFITSTVLPAIAEMSSQYDKMTENVIQEMNHYIQETVEDIDHRERERRQFESALVAQQLLQLISLGGSILSIFGVHHSYGDVGKLAHSLYLYHVRPYTDADPRPAPSLPGAFTPPRNSLQMLENDKYFSQVNQSVPIQEAIILELMSNHSLYLSGGDIPAKLRDVQLAFHHLEQMVAAEYSSLVDVYEARQNFESAQDELISALKRKHEEMIRTGNVQSLKVATSIQNTIPQLKMAEVNPSLYTAIKSTHQNRFAKMLKGSQQTLKNIENRKRSIYRVFLPVLKATLAEVQQKVGKIDSNHSSTATLSVYKWQVLEMLKSVKVELKGFVQGLAAEEQLIACLDKLEQSFSIMIELYENMEKYEEQKELANFIAQVNSPNQLAIDAHDDKAEIVSLLTKTELLLMVNLFQLDYQLAVNAFKQWVFPFAHNYLQHDYLNQTTEAIAHLLDDGVTQDIAQIAELYLSHIEKLRSATTKYNSMTVSGDDILMKSYFSSDTVSSVPFYMWKNEKWGHSIHQLLTGEKIGLHAHVCETNETESMAAIKFKTIELHLKHRNASAQQELDNELEKYILMMTHSGISHYRVLSDVVVMRGANQSFRYSFERRCGRNDGCGSLPLTIRSSNQRVTSNVIYDKFQGQLTDYILSPYTMWSFQLIRSKLKSRESSTFQLLEKFANDVDLELRGEGMYIDQDQYGYGSSLLQQLNIGAFYHIDSRCSENVFNR